VWFDNSKTLQFYSLIPSIVPRWCLLRRDHKTGNSRGQETTALPVIEVSKNLLSIAL